jgi:predicted negative regulator of RcsB-dependent stress response
MFAAAGSQDLALLALDEGIARLGPVVTLELEAIDLTVRGKRYDEALLRLDRIASQTPRKETWLERRGDVLEKAGRLSEAREAYQAAFDALSLLPAWTQETQASTTVRARLRTDLARVNRRLASSAQDHQ